MKSGAENISVTFSGETSRISKYWFAVSINGKEDEEIEFSLTRDEELAAGSNGFNRLTPEVQKELIDKARQLI